jgi:hypothetical protein
MIDIKILTIKDILTVSGARYANITPRSLIIEGEHFTQASEVLINDEVAPEFIIIDDHKIIAQVPNLERNKILRKVAVLSETASPDHRSLLSFSVGRTFQKLEGLERLIQLFTKILLQTPGSDKFEPGIGGGLMTFVGKTFSGDTAKVMQTGAVTAVNRTRDQIISIQAKNRRLPADEKLLTANVEAVGFNETITTLLMRILITAVSGRQAVANLAAAPTTV